MSEEQTGEAPPLDYRRLNVMAEQCAECLLSPGALVDPERRREIIEGCRASGAFFVCHRATIEGGLIVCCRAFYDTQQTEAIDLAKREDLVNFVREEDLPSLNPAGHQTMTPDIALLMALRGARGRKEGEGY